MPYELAGKVVLIQLQSEFLVFLKRVLDRFRYDGRLISFHAV